MMNTHSMLSIPNNSTQGNTLFLNHLSGAALTLALREISEQHSGPVMIVTPDSHTGIRLQNELHSLTELPTSLFPDWESLPYDHFSPHQDIISERLAQLYQLPLKQQGITLVSASTLLQRLCPTSFLQQNALIIKNGDQLSLEKLRHQLEISGYRHVDQVMEHGEYASRGSLLDLFPMGSRVPFRLDFFDNEIDSIRSFDPDTQRSNEPCPHIRLLPAHEFPTTTAAIELFRAQWREQLPISREPESVYQQISQSQWSNGIEYWQPLFFTQTDTLFDYASEQTLWIIAGDIETSIRQFLTDTQHRFEQRGVDPLRPLLPPEKLWLREDELFHHLKSKQKVRILPSESDTKKGQYTVPICALPDLALNNKLKVPFGLLQEFCTAFTGKLIFSVSSEGRREALVDLLSEIQLRPHYANNINEAIQSTEQYLIIISATEQGFQFENGSLAFLCENDLLGEYRQPIQRKSNKTTVNSDTLIRNLAEIKVGQPVVHLEHGIGRYLGLQTLDAGGITTEFVTLEYQNEAKLYVPVAALHLISRYSGGSEETAPLHRLGGEVWAKSRKKAAEKVRDVAAELLDIYANRELKPGYAFKLDHESYAQFRGGFAFNETDDQALAINSVLSDMCQKKAMDRLVCGDVGFGKTEVAMRAAFLAIDNGKQVTILVPTTLLAQQHFENFRDRFVNTAARVEVLSRFKTPKEQKAILADVEAGNIDILIGTHKLLNTQVAYKDLGLLIVDEEHRFGVRQKEKIKTLRANIDILTLTATPIPRTLNMAMSGMRDLSIIATPPARRLAIKTFVRQYDEPTVREAILREITRGGQVYYLHNDVETIEKVANDLSVLLPEARVTIGHGQMRERELEKVMNDFCRQRFNVLVCTTIIETGIDVPSANTIIINRADRLGLAQLHQLRGRVGRSHHQAYAYLLTPPPKSISKDAVKRLEAIASLEDLGAGFTLATHDLEIRGAGELLGDDQSGQIQSVGFRLFMEMLDQAVEALKEGKEPTLENLLKQQTDIELRIPALFPDDYIPDINTRLSLYKQMAGATDIAQLDDMRIELIDRFGTLPEATKNLLAISKLKRQAADIGIIKIEMGDQGGNLEFGTTTNVNPSFIIGLLQTQPQHYRMDGPVKLKITAPLTNPKDRLQWVTDFLTKLTANTL